MTETAVYLYGVAQGLAPDALGDVAGVSGAPVRGVPAGGLTALVSTVRLDDYGEAALRANLEDLAWLEATARAHHDVVDRAAHAAPTAPVRIATLYRDDARVAEVLTEQGDRFGAVFDRIAGRSEWAVKAYARPRTGRPAEGGGSDPAQDPGGGREPSAAPLTGPATGPAGADGGGTGAGVGTAYLRRLQDERRRRAAAERRLAEQAAAIHAELADHAVAARHHPPQDPRLSGRPETQILNVAYLLDDEQAPGFQAVIGALAERLPDVEVEVAGPWPPYSFIDTGDVGDPGDTVESAPPPGAEGAGR